MKQGRGDLSSKHASMKMKMNDADTRRINALISKKIQPQDCCVRTHCIIVSFTLLLSLLFPYYAALETSIPEGHFPLIDFILFHFIPSHSFSLIERTAAATGVRCIRIRIRIRSIE